MKKYLILLCFSVYSFCIFDNLKTTTEINAGYQKYNNENMIFLSAGINAQYERKITEKAKIIVGPSINIIYGNNLLKENKYVFSTNIGINIKGKYEIKENIGIYSKAEALVGGSIQNDINDKINYKFYPTIYGGFGAYYKNVNIGLYSGYGKGYIGIETEIEF